MVKLYIIGITILIIAILANVLANRLSIMTWYDFLNRIADQGIGSIKTIGILNGIWLFILYPLTLGIGYWVGAKICAFILR